jgi:DNA-binding NtrC family response regulator
MMRAGTVVPPPEGASRRPGQQSARRPLPPAAARAPFAYHGLIGRTPAMQQLFAAIERFAPHARATLVTGETGTGKTAVAWTLYRLGPRRGGAFVPVACAELDGGGTDADWASRIAAAPDADTTLFFDDVADLPVVEQRRLAHLLTTAESIAARGVDVHVIAATVHDLRAAIADGRFRPDLYYRLGVFALHVPPLRDRLADVPDLAAAFLRDIAQRLLLEARGVTPAAMRVLQAQAWPGNLRELHNVLERAAVLSDDVVVGEGAVRAALGGAPAMTPASAEPSTGATTTRLDHAQREHVRGVLRGLHGNKTRAAASLGISRRALYRLIDRLGA